MHNEIELKLLASPEAVNNVANSRSIRKHKAGKSAIRELVTTYFDTPRHTLKRAGIVLRVRQDGEVYEQTVKVPVTGPTGLLSNLEQTGRVPGNAPSIGAIDDEALRAILKVGRRDKRLIPVFASQVQRQTIPLRLHGTRVELALDIGTLAAPNGCSAPISEIELELEKGKAVALLDLALQLNESQDLKLGFLTKAERGYALARRALRARAIKAQPLELVPAMTVHESFYAIMQNALGHLRANEKPVTEGHPDGVHQARVAIRRIRAALRAYKHALPYDKRKAFNGEFRWFQQRLSPARDWHVFLDETLPAIAAAHLAQHATVARLRRIGLSELARAKRDATDLFETRRYTRLILQFIKWLAEPHEVLSPADFGLPVSDFAVGVLTRTRKDFLSEVRPLSRMPPEDRHTLRKRGKKARYASEFFAPLWPDTATVSYLELLKELQDALGQANDASTASQLVVRLKPGLLDPETAWLVQKWSAKQIPQCNGRAQPKWGKYRRLEPFWIGKPAGGEPADSWRQD